MTFKASPLDKPIIENGVVCSEDKDGIKPPLREKAAAMILYNIPTLTHPLLQLIHNLNMSDSNNLEAC